MTAKERCKLLKQIRKEIAESNGIDFCPAECTDDTECLGTCPKCEKEAKYLDNALIKKAGRGETILLFGRSVDKYSAPTVIGEETNTFIPEKQSESSADEIHIEELQLSSSILRFLSGVGIHTVKNLCEYTKSDIMRIKNLGKKSVEEVAARLHSRGLAFKAEKTMQQRIRDAMLGLAIGDAMGVPVKSVSRESLKRNPVTGYRGHGSYDVSVGTWAGATSMSIATLDSLSEGLNYSDIMDKFVDWTKNATYTASNKVFDIDNTVYNALANYRGGNPPLQCGQCSENDNGNASLMRILPAVFYIKEKIPFKNMDEKMEIIYNISSLTHGHTRSKIACGIYAIVMQTVIDKNSEKYVHEDIQSALRSARRYYSNSSEISYYNQLFSQNFAQIPESEIKTTEYVVDTLEAAIWCVLNSNSYRDCILKAVNLGDDTDTVAAVAGSIAGCIYDIPQDLIDGLTWHEEIERLCDKFLGIETTV